MPSSVLAPGLGVVEVRLAPLLILEYRDDRAVVLSCQPTSFARTAGLGTCVRRALPALRHHPRGGSLRFWFWFWWFAGSGSVGCLHTCNPHLTQLVAGGAPALATSQPRAVSHSTSYRNCTPKLSSTASSIPELPRNRTVGRRLPPAKYRQLHRCCRRCRTMKRWSPRTTMRSMYRSLKASRWRWRPAQVRHHPEEQRIWQEALPVAPVLCLVVDEAHAQGAVVLLARSTIAMPGGAAGSSDGVYGQSASSTACSAAGTQPNVAIDASRLRCSASLNSDHSTAAAAGSADPWPGCSTDSASLRRPLPAGAF